ncbi:MAG: dienelactone hydrolase family protein [Deltaproteobacteria bacterium]|nr:dienelactone hydrolase family protein [Deltaproteobacteria bacterium]
MKGHYETADVNGKAMRMFVDGERDRPGVVVMVHEPGLDGFIEAQVTALAEAGYFVAAPDVFHRQTDPTLDTKTRIDRLRDQEITEDGRAAVAHLRERTQAPIAVIGFCMGGRNAYHLAGACPELWSGAVVFYGGDIMTGWGAEATPLDRTLAITCPVLGIFGNDDTNPSQADVARIDAELTRLGKPHTFHSYAGAGHSFLNFTNPELHRPEQAADAWQKMLEFLRHPFSA